MSVIEVERKRELGDVVALRTRLADTGFREVGTSVEVDTYYSRPDVDFLATVECLRVRRSDEFAEITYKPPSDAVTHSAAGVIAKPETTVVLSSPSQATAADTLLDVLGMVALCTVEKSRTSFRHPDHDDVTVAIDLVTGVGPFVETEVMAHDPAVATLLLDEVERQLGLTACPVVRLPYRDLILHRTTA
ncbi:adenylate cyclase [Actinophytocola xinjiangensis]|uniref:Adenylate cyclase n=1 Tax=Actinophytocola xinjiangensis TaxID=485602 RepID=A0A7Z0WF28_9PSEU|nr:class IV adenylate cyclase [Actinophytocola xinjiangensis]OLF05831.1 adenylate cyclase [Actinophytocola xinjiangensis]